MYVLTILIDVFDVRDDRYCFSSRRRHTRCALVTGVQTCALPIYRISRSLEAAHYEPGSIIGSEQELREQNNAGRALFRQAMRILEARKSVVQGKSVSGRVDLGGRRIIKKKTTHTNPTNQQNTKSIKNRTRYEHIIETHSRH